MGFGSWAIGGSGWQFAWGNQNDSDSVAAIHRALEHGVNWIDTAAVYGLGHSEEIVARSSGHMARTASLRFHQMRPALGQQRPDIPQASRPCIYPARVRRQLCVAWKVETDRPIPNSLARLRTAEIEEGWTEMAKLQREGKVRWIGVSNFDVDQMQLAQSIAPITSLQPRYSLIPIA